MRQIARDLGLAHEFDRDHGRGHDFSSRPPIPGRRRDRKSNRNRKKVAA
jgi:hypothetical protein